MITNKELLMEIERQLWLISDDEGMVSIDQIRNVINEALTQLSHAPVPVKKFMFIEDGSVDADELHAYLNNSNPEIRVVVYRQGTCPPVLIDAEKGVAND